MKYYYLLIIHLVLLIFSILQISCNKSDNKNNDVPLRPNTPRPVYQGELDKKLSEIYSKDNEDYFEKCDFNNRNKIISLARVLEEKRDEIANFVKSNPPAIEYEYLEFGKFKFIDDLKKISNENEWNQDEFL